jgi:hypothetical protein
MSILLVSPSLLCFITESSLLFMFFVMDLAQNRVAGK